MTKCEDAHHNRLTCLRKPKVCILEIKDNNFYCN